MALFDQKIFLYMFEGPSKKFQNHSRTSSRVEMLFLYFFLLLQTSRAQGNCKHFKSIFVTLHYGVG